MKPFIGITCNFDTNDQIGLITDMGVKGQSWDYIASNYSRAVEEAGGIPVLIPICEEFETVKEILDRVDGVLLSGGHDVSPLRYGEPIRKCGVIETARDEQDLKVACYIMDETDKPLLGICRGCQIINVSRKGTMYQELLDDGFSLHSCEMSPLNEPVHTVSVKGKTKLKEIYGAENVGVNSYHHQGLKALGEGLEISAVSEDGVTEGIEMPDRTFVVGVQWHPEMMYDSKQQKKLFRAFVNACKS